MKEAFLMKRRKVLAVILSLCLLITMTAGMTIVASADEMEITTEIKVAYNFSYSDDTRSYTYSLCRTNNTNMLFISASFSINRIVDYTIDWYSNQTASTEGGTLVVSDEWYILYRSGGSNNNLGNAGTTTYYYYILTVIDSSSKEVLATETVGPIAFTVVEHDYTSEVTTEATCTEAGVKTYTCSACGDSYTETIAATGHTPDGEGTITRAATCTEAGEITYTCSVCNETYTESIPATGIHTAGETVVENNVPATCTEDGSYDEVVYCSVCGEKLSSDTITVPATGHSYEAVVTAPTCTEGGYTTYTCSVCGDSYTADETEALGHSYEFQGFTWSGDLKSATATFKCSACDDTQTVDATVTSRNVLGVVTRVATVEFDGVSYTSDTVTTGTSLLIIGVLNQTGSEEVASEETDSEDVEITEPIEDTNSDTEPDEELEVTSDETNPTTGAVVALLPIAIAIAGTISKKRG